MDRLPDVEFAVPGDPVPEGSHSVYQREGHRPVLVGVTPELRTWRAEIRRYATMAMRGKRPYAGAMALSLQFVVARPAKLPPGRLAPSVRPDLDKLVRAVGDALSTTPQGPGICFTDDAQLTEFWPPFCKRYVTAGERTGVIIRLWALGPQQQTLSELLDESSPE